MAKPLRPKELLAAIILIAVLLRIGAAFLLGSEVTVLPGTFDQVSYHNLALRLLDGHGFSFGELWWPATPAGEPTAHWSFLYTLYLAAVYSLAGPNPLVARLIQAVIVGVFMPLLIYRLSTQLFSTDAAGEAGSNDFHKGQIIGLNAAGISAIYIYFFYYAGTLMTESFYFLGILASLSLAIDLGRPERQTLGRWLLFGLALGLTLLLRQVFLLFIPFLFLWIWYAGRPKLLSFAAPLLIIALLILPWSVRNYFAFDQFVLLNTNSGFAFYWGNHPIYGTQFVSILPAEMGTYFDLLPQDLLHLNEAELNSAVMDLAVAEILSDPVRYVLLSISRIHPYFKFWPSADSGMVSNLSRVGSFGLFLPFMLFGLVRTLFYRYPTLRDRLASPFTLIYLFFAVYTGVHLLTWTLIRYRLPLDALLVIFAGLALVKLAEWVVPHRLRPRSTSQPTSNA